VRGLRRPRNRPEIAAFFDVLADVFVKPATPSNSARTQQIVEKVGDPCRYWISALAEKHAPVGSDLRLSAGSFVGRMVAGTGLEPASR